MNLSDLIMLRGPFPPPPMRAVRKHLAVIYHSKP